MLFFSFFEKDVYIFLKEFFSYGDIYQTSIYQESLGKMQNIITILEVREVKKERNDDATLLD